MKRYVLSRIFWTALLAGLALLCAKGGADVRAGGEIAPPGKSYLLKWEKDGALRLFELDGDSSRLLSERSVPRLRRADEALLADGVYTATAAEALMLMEDFAG